MAELSVPGKNTSTKTIPWSFIFAASHVISQFPRHIATIKTSQNVTPSPNNHLLNHEGFSSNKLF